MIGRHTYAHLKSLPNLTEEQKKQIEDFEENKKKMLPEEAKKNLINYTEKLKETNQEKPKIDLKNLFYWFLAAYQDVNRVEFIRNPDSEKNIKTLLYYFMRDERFFDCENVSDLSNPSLDKGLLVVGGFGIGKSSVFKAFHKVFLMFHDIRYRYDEINEIVSEYEGVKENYDRQYFWKKYTIHPMYIDDIKTERHASNYGKVNVVKELLEKRYNTRVKTYASMNYKEGFEGDLSASIDELGEKYGGRVFDRIFEMFNIVEFTGKSFRK